MYFQDQNYYKRRTMSRTVSKSQKHCTICAKAGLPEEVYSNHFVRETRDVSSRVTCPLLKNNICSRCGKKGHFVSSCKVVFREKVPVQVIQKVKVNTTNTYDFGSESEDESQEAQAEVQAEPEEYPELPKQTDKDYSKRFTLECWQAENKHLLDKPENERKTDHFYWDPKFKLFCGNNFSIVEKRVMLLGKEVTIQVIEPKKRSWADDSDDE